MAKKILSFEEYQVQLKAEQDAIKSAKKSKGGTTQTLSANNQPTIPKHLQ